MEKKTLIEELRTLARDYTALSEAQNKVNALLKEKEDINSKLMRDWIKMRDHYSNAEETKQLLKEKVAHSEQKLNARNETITTLEERVTTSTAETARLIEALGRCRVLIAGLHKEVTTLKDRHKQLIGRAELAEASATEWKKQKEIEALKRRTTEDSMRNKEMEITKLRVICDASASGSGGEADERVQKMLLMYKNLFTCAVCHERQKSVILTSCFHTFCRECIEQNIKSRSRKCPACSTSFAMEQVHDFFF